MAGCSFSIAVSFISPLDSSVDTGVLYDESTECVNSPDRVSDSCWCPGTEYRLLGAIKDAIEHQAHNRMVQKRSKKVKKGHSFKIVVACVYEFSGTYKGCTGVVRSTWSKDLVFLI